MSWSARILAAALVLAGLLVTRAASADVIISNEADCIGKDAGAPCGSWNFDGVGACSPSKCSRRDYSSGVPPKRKEVDCLRCLPRPKDGGTPGPSGYGTGKKP